ncbi:MAG: hypothetical protein Q7K03_02285 [Dehalococcoidia bacterium]|nr:hypothetical protein [Dehalococcoidia bacterium]
MARAGIVPDVAFNLASEGVGWAVEHGLSALFAVKPTPSASRLEQVVERQFKAALHGSGGTPVPEPVYSLPSARLEAVEALRKAELQLRATLAHLPQGGTVPSSTSAIAAVRGLLEQAKATGEMGRFLGRVLQDMTERLQSEQSTESLAGVLRLVQRCISVAERSGQSCPTCSTAAVQSTELTEAPSRDWPTTAETVVALKRRLTRELLQFQDDLLDRCKLEGKACDCCSSKHPLSIEAKVMELMTMDDNPAYFGLLQWMDQSKPRLTAEASASGEYDEWYVGEAVRAIREFRKRITGTEELEHVGVEK